MIRSTSPRSSRWLLLMMAPLLLAVLWAGGVTTLLEPQDSVASNRPLRADSPVPYVPHPKLDDHLIQLGVDDWHDRNITGQGIKVAVLDSGFQGYRRYLGGALPKMILSRSFRLDGDLEAKASRHGILCAEIIHAIAPDADLLFANWEPDSPEHFLKAVEWACRQGADVISCSVVMPGWSDGEGGGRIHEKLAELIGKGDHSSDPVFLASAGNLAQRHWLGMFHDNGQGIHEWIPNDCQNTLNPWGTRSVSVEWTAVRSRSRPAKATSQGSKRLVRRASAGGCSRSRRALACSLTAPQAGLRWGLATSQGRKRLVRRASAGDEKGAGSSRYRLEIFDLANNRRVGSSVDLPADDINGGAVRFRPREGHKYALCLRLLSGPGGEVRIVTLGSAMEHYTSKGSIAFPADGHSIIAVGAVDDRGVRAGYSSCGPNSSMLKPELVARVPFPTSCRDDPFTGTSAAAPQAAGIAALWRSAYPNCPATEVRNALCRSASDLAQTGHDWETGFGQVRLPLLQRERNRNRLVTSGGSRR